MNGRNTKLAFHGLFKQMKMKTICKNFKKLSMQVCFLCRYFLVTNLSKTFENRIITETGHSDFKKSSCAAVKGVKPGI